MTNQYYTREGDITAVDTKTALSTTGSETAPGALNVPSGGKKLKALIVAVMANFAAVGAWTSFVRLEGKGLPGGPYVIAAGAGGGNIATGMHGHMKAMKIPMDVSVTPNNEVLVFGEMTGADVGQLTMGVTLEFEV